jgi:hypothetical protein
VNRIMHRTALVGLTLAAGQVSAIDKSWFAANGNWNVPGNWTPNGVPNPGDNVYIGNLPIAFNSTVTINNNTTIAGLSLTDGMTLDTNLSRLTVAGPTTISGSNLDGIVRYDSRLRVGQSAQVEDARLQALTVSNGGRVAIDDGGTLLVEGLFTLEDSAKLSGHGIVNISDGGGVAMVVDGFLQPSADAGGLVINQLGSGRVDLDGTLVDDRIIGVTASQSDGSAFASLTINGDQLTDSFDEAFWIRENNTVSMNLANGWAMGSQSEIRMLPNPIFPGIARVNGTELTFSGLINVSGDNAHGRFNAPVNLEPASRTTIAAGGILEFSNDTVINGGTHEVGFDGELAFNDATTVRGGSFSTVSTSQFDGRVVFYGTTTWDGTVSFEGFARQHGAAHVNSLAIINADVFDLDGNTSTHWTLTNSLIVNAQAIDSGGSTFNASMSMSGLGIARINLADPAAHWTMAGEMDLIGGVLPMTRIAGSPVHIEGAVTLTNKVRFEADTRLLPGSTTTFGVPGSVMVIGNEGFIEDGANFVGFGEIQVQADGHLTLGDELSLNVTELENNGAVSVGPIAGFASVQTYRQGNGGELRIQIGGNNPGVNRDFLFVGGPGGAILDGTLRVELIENGGVPFVPAVGATFSVISAGTISGTFDSVPPSVVGDATVEWEVLYLRNSVSVRVVSVVSSCRADFNSDGFLDFFDYTDFVNCFEGGGCPEGTSADFNNDGFVDFFDYNDFVAAFESGC